LFTTLTSAQQAALRYPAIELQPRTAAKGDQGILSYRPHNTAPRADADNEANTRDHWQLL